MWDKFEIDDLNIPEYTTLWEVWSSDDDSGGEMTVNFSDHSCIYLSVYYVRPLPTGYCLQVVCKAIFRLQLLPQLINRCIGSLKPWGYFVHKPGGK